MLNDNVIQAFQQMLKIQYPDANDLQDPVLSQALNFDGYQTILFVQVLHDRSLHWIAISTHNCKEGDVFLINSMFCGRVTHETKREICSILNSDKKELKIVALLVQEQSNAINCGVFALAFIPYILSEKNTPVEVNFDTFKMRTHLLHVPVENELSQFPRSDRNHRKCIHKTISIALLCNCRMPWAKSDNRLFDKQMVKCDRCCE